MEHNFKWKNDGRTKVMIGCGTRPEIIRLAAVIKRCREYFDCCVVYYNQNWDRNLSTVFWEDFELKNTFGEYGPDILVPVVGENLGVTCGNIMGRSYELLSELQPEGYLVLGDYVHQKMGWDSECRYKMLGYRITFEGETLYVFDLLVPEIFHEGQRKKNAVDSQDNAASTKPVNSRKGFYLDDIVGTFGVPVEEHRKESEVKQMDGYVSMGILTGKIAPEAGKD